MALKDLDNSYYKVCNDLELLEGTAKDDEEDDVLQEYRDQFYVISNDYKMIMNYLERDTIHYLDIYLRILMGNLSTGSTEGKDIEVRFNW